MHAKAAARAYDQGGFAGLESCRVLQRVDRNADGTGKQRGLYEVNGFGNRNCAGSRYAHVLGKAAVECMSEAQPTHAAILVSGHTAAAFAAVGC